MKKVVFLCVWLILFSANLFAQIGTGDLNFVKKSEVLMRPRTVTDVDVLKVENVSSTLEMEKKAFGLLNEKRGEKGLPPLIWDDEVAKIARIHSQNMASYNFFSHKGLDGSLVSDRADKIGLSKWRLIGENIVYLRGYRNPVEFAVECWMNSALHKENLLNKDWKQSAVGVAITENGTYYFTQVFLLRK
jgi:uncharacterized protein YkwD